jgi:hypothetical protein
LKRKKKIQTSNWEKPNQSIVKIVYVKKKVPFKNNENYLLDRKEFDRLFKINKAIKPKFFIDLENELKNKNRVDEILSYVMMHLKGKPIKEIDLLQKVPVKKKIVSPRARIVRKK